MRRSTRLRAPAPDAWPRSVRIACACAGLALLAALLLGTRREVLAVYGRNEAVESRTPLHLPMMPPPPFPQQSEGGNDVTAPQRFLVHVLVARRDFGLGQKPVLLWEWDYRWPDDKDKQAWCAVREESDPSVHLLRLARVYLSEGLTACWDVEFRHGFPLSRFGCTFSDGCDWSSAEDAQAYVSFEGELGLDRDALLRGPLSLVPRRAPSQLVLALSVHRVVPDEPLRAAATEEVLERLRTRYAPSFSSGFGTVSQSLLGGGALRYAQRTGLVLVPLLALPLFLAQLHRRRSFAFLALLVPAVLLAIGSDRWALGIHRERLADRAASLEERALALDSLETSFFYRDTALVAASRIAQDPAEPKLLRRKAAAVASRIRSREVTP